MGSAFIDKVMSMPHRFFVDSRAVSGNTAVLDGENARHARVLRLTAGERVILCDGNSRDYICSITEVGGESLTLAVEGIETNRAEPAVRITLFQSLTKSDNMDYIIQKAVELGAAEIIPVQTRYCVSRINADTQKKTARWRKIAEEAAKQSGRGVTPIVGGAVSFAEAVKLSAVLDETYMAYERYDGLPLISEFERSEGDRVGIFIGPEGGLSAEEAELAAGSGVRLISLGKRILRVETAGIAAIVALMCARREM